MDELNPFDPDRLAREAHGSIWLRVMRLPLALATANYLLWPVASIAIPVGASAIGFNVVRICLMVWAGSVVTRRGTSGLGGAALAGLAILVVDHLVLKGGTFLLYHALGRRVEQGSYLMAFGGVVVSFVMLSPIVALLGLCGGLLGRRQNVSHVP